MYSASLSSLIVLFCQLDYVGTRFCALVDARERDSLEEGVTSVLYCDTVVTLRQQIDRCTNSTVAGIGTADGLL